MKIWKKIFLCTLILFIVVFNGAGIIVIENIYHKNMDISVKSALNNEKDIINLIYLNSDLLQGYIGDDLWNILKNYIYSDSNEIKNIEIFNDKNKQILKTSNLNIPNDREELKNEHMDKIKFLIRTINSKKYVSVVSMIKIGTGSYKIVMSKDITYVNQDRIDNYKIFLLLSLVVTLILAIGLYIISKKITNPIESLIEVSNSIRKGEYNKRAYYKKNDEIGVLSQNFNSMMTVIEDNICELKQVNDEKQRFIDNLTHEMKTPITSIIGYSDLLLKSNINDEIRF
ncbi:HAMP domain-containing protein, partial [Clostridium botulinum]